MQTLLISFFVLFHPMHISVSEAEYSEKDKALQITSRIFIDDLELAIRAQRNEPDMDLLEPKNGSTTDKLVSAYLADHFKVTIDGKVQKMNLLGTEREGLALICYIEIPSVKKMKSLDVFNSILTEIHDDQSNLFNITFKSPVKSARLTKSSPSETFRFDGK